MELSYCEFKKDCYQIVGEFLKPYGYVYNEKMSDDFINMYTNENGVIFISMLDNFPHIGVSFGFKTNDGEDIPFRLIDSIIKVDSKEKMEFYNAFSKEYNLNEYPIQMLYSVRTLEKFYKPILTATSPLSLTISERYK